MTSISHNQSALAGISFVGDFEPKGQIILQELAIIPPAPWPATTDPNGPAFSEMGVVIETTRHSKLFYDARGLGVWGRLSNGQGFGAMLSGIEPNLITAPTEAALRELLNESLAQPAYIPGLHDWRALRGHAASKVALAPMEATRGHGADFAMSEEHEQAHEPRAADTAPEDPNRSIYDDFAKDFGI